MTSSEVQSTVEAADWAPDGPRLGYALAFGTVIVVALPLNMVSLWILLRRHSLKSPSAVFMVNLAVSDLLLAVSLPLRVYFYATGSWPFNLAACLSTSMLFCNNIRSSSIFISFISVDRLLAVVYPLRSRHLRTASNASKAAGLSWLFVCVINIPEVVLTVKSKQMSKRTGCFDLHAKYLEDTLFRYTQPSLMLVLLVVNVVSTALVLWTLHRRPHVSVLISNKVNVMLIFAMNLAMFTLCFLPVSLSLLALESHVPLPLVCLASINCCLDPLLYYFSLDAFWKKKKKKKDERAMDTGPDQLTRIHMC